MRLSIESERISVSASEVLAWQWRLTELLDQVDGEVSDVIEELRDFLAETYHMGRREGS